MSGPRRSAIETERVNAFILAGGRSTRMGRDKATLLMGGRPLAAHAAGLLRSLGCEPRICGSRPDLASFAEIIPDRRPQCGPLGGIEAALAASDSELNLFVPVDLPGIPPAFLQWLISRAQTSHAAATIPRLGGQPQPLCAVYSRRLLKGLGAALDAGRFKITTAIADSAAALGESVDLFHLETVAAALPAGLWPSEPPLREWFLNVNTPADYQRLQRVTASKPGANLRHPIS